ncbi:MAG: GreA/GreB family elongation factor [Patescibacteria group bacterium]
MQIPKRKSESDRQAMHQQDNYLTLEAIERMKKKLARLKNERPALIEELTRTQAMGDLSENAGYQNAKFALRRNENQILNIEERITYAIPIEPGSENGEIRLGSTVVVRANGREYVFEILGVQEADPLHGKISYKSPLGELLLGHRAGDKVTLKKENGEIEYEILEVK